MHACRLSCTHLRTLCDVHGLCSSVLELYHFEWDNCTVFHSIIFNFSYVEERHFFCGTSQIRYEKSMLEYYRDTYMWHYLRLISEDVSWITLAGYKQWQPVNANVSVLPTFNTGRNFEVQLLQGNLRVRLQNFHINIASEWEIIPAVSLYLSVETLPESLDRISSSYNVYRLACFHGDDCKCRSAGQASLAAAVSQVACQGAPSLGVIDGSPQAGHVKVNLNDRVGSRTHVLPQFPAVSAAHPKLNLPPPPPQNTSLLEGWLQLQNPGPLSQTSNTNSNWFKKPAISTVSNNSCGFVSRSLSSTELGSGNSLDP
jgi:hypothetical protein